MEENLSQETLADASQLNAAEGGRTVSNENSVSLEEINSFLGQKFIDKATALKALKDTQSFVGKRKEDIEKEVLDRARSNADVDGMSKQLKEMRDDMWFEKNPSYKPYRNAMQKMGAEPGQVAEMPEFKELFTESTSFRESQKLKTVLSSNPRIAQTRTKMDEARSMMKEASQTGNPRMKEEAENMIVRSLREMHGK